jgi:chromate transporter
LSFELFLTFFKIGIFTIGGGYTMIPLIEKEIIEEKKWINKEEMVEIIAISQMTPGPIATNAATFIGKKMGGIRGAVMATFGVVLPSLIIITFIAAFLSVNFENIYVQKAFTGLRAGITAMIFLSVKKLAKPVLFDNIAYIIFALTMLLLIFKIISPVYIIIIAGCGAAGIYYIREEIKKWYI